MAPRAVLAALVLLLLAAPPALAGDASLRVNEVYPAAPGEAFVELLDVFPSNSQFHGERFFVASYDSADNPVDRQTYTPPYPFASRTTPFVLGHGGDAPPLALAPGAGKVCFESEGIFNELQMHCLAYADVPPGRSVQRQPCGRAGTAAPTRGQENTPLPAVCEGRRPCDDPRNRIPTSPKLRVLGKKIQDVDRFAVRFVLNRDGDVGTKGGIGIGNLGRGKTHHWGPLSLDLEANVPRRLKVPIPASFVRKIKRSLRRGEEVTLTVVSVGRDDQCPPNRSHSSRLYELTN